MELAQSLLNRQQVRAEVLLVKSLADGDRELFDLAFGLAYFIHVNKEIAFFIAEDALDALPSTLSYQSKNRKPPTGLRGFLKWGERTRPVRKTLLLHEHQMLQWLVFKESISWELKTERGGGPYSPTEEDLIIRYIEHLVFTAVRRNSFYVTLAIGSLLHQFDRRETRLFYDILTQSDSARMKDTNYIGKQRLELLDRLGQRFEGMVTIAKKTGEEKQFQMRPTTQWVIELVNETLRRFTPSQTACVLGPNFEVTDIPAFYFADDDNDEDSIEKSRIHTVIDPDCFERFCGGLARYVRRLPNSDLDRACSFESPNQRIAVPQFSISQEGPRRNNRLQAPTLVDEDYLRLQRMLEARGHRKKAFTAQRVLIYADGVLSSSFEPQKQNFGRCVIAPNTSCIEVRGRDSEGELMLATVLMDDQALDEKAEILFTHPEGKRTLITLVPLRIPEYGGGRIILEVTHSQKAPGIIERARGNRSRSISGQSGHNQSQFLLSNRSGWPAKFAFITVLIFGTVLFFGWRLSVRRDHTPNVESIRQPATPAPGDSALSGSVTNAPSTSPTQNKSPRVVTKIALAEARWNMQPEAALIAKSIEATRSEPLKLDLSAHHPKVTISIPVYDSRGIAFSDYRLDLSRGNKRIWRKTLRAPEKSSTSYAHLLDLMLFKERLVMLDRYELFVFGRTKLGWRPVGTMTLITGP